MARLHAVTPEGGLAASRTEPLRKHELNFPVNANLQYDDVHSFPLLPSSTAGYGDETASNDHMKFTN